MGGCRFDDVVQRSDPKVVVVRNGYAMAGRQIRLKYDVAAAFVHDPVPELPNEHLRQGAPLRPLGIFMPA
jgi:hypothetical protein